MAFSVFRTKRVVSQSKTYSQEIELYRLEKNTGEPLLHFKCLDICVESSQSWVISSSVFPLSWKKKNPCPLENFPFSNLRPLTPDQPPCTLKKTGSIFSVTSHKVFLKPSSLKPGKTSQTLLHTISSMTFAGPTQCTSIICVLGSPKLDTGLEL